jgi:heme/copper-type cytochrome/quinol oxidase subunit 2
MKGLQTGMFYLIYGIFSAIGSTIYYVYPIHLKQAFAINWSLFCVVLLSIGIVGLVVYALVAWCYKNRQRPATDEAEVQRILMYANVYGAKS